MREFLLRSASIVAMIVPVLHTASAQTPPIPLQPTQGVVAAPSMPNATANAGNAVTGEPNRFQGYTKSFSGTLPAPAPGTVIIRLNGKVEVDLNAFSTTSNKSVTVGGGPSGFKVNPISFGSLARLYPAVDGMTTNGLRYGAAIELRENFGAPTGLASAGATTAGGVQPVGLSGGTPASGTAVAAASSASAYSSSETVFVRRMFAYFAADDYGLVRLGQADGLIGIFDPCVFSAQCWDAGVGALNAGGIQIAAPSNAVGIPFVWVSQSGAEYANTKVVYISPQIYGVDFGVQYAPGMDNGFGASTGATATSLGLCAQPGPNCVGTTTGVDGTRWYNQFAVGARWQHQLGPLRTGLMAVYETAGKESVIGPAIQSGGPGKVLGNRYDNLNFVEAAGYAALDTGIGTVTGSLDWIGGALNGQVAMRPTGGVPESAFLTGVMLRNGRITLGSQVGLIFSQGAAQLTGISQRREFEMAFGGNYNIAPGIFLVAEYQYEARHQGDFDFSAGAVGPTRDARAQGVTLSTVVNW
jgi:hypothetical protein